LVIVVQNYLCAHPKVTE